MELIASCAFGLEKLVYDELKKLGFWVIKTEDGRVSFEGDNLALVRANLWLRCVDRVQIKMAEFSATTFDQLFDAVYALDWAKYIGVMDAFPVTASSSRSMLHSEPAIQSIVKKAVVKKLQLSHANETLSESSEASYPIMVKVNKDGFVVSINSSGDSLHKRGYRTAAALAPIKETLAAAMVMFSDWTPDKPLVDVFCGSGTIGIEAAMIGANVAPGLGREFLFQRWSWVEEEVVRAAYDEARGAMRDKDGLKIYCFDVDAETLEIAQENAARAGFKNLNFKRADFNDLDFAEFKDCTFVENPPYGERLEDVAAVEEIYRRFGEKFKDTQNCSLYLITSNENFPALFGWEVDKNRKLFNGRIQCYLYQYFKKG